MVSVFFMVKICHKKHQKYMLIFYDNSPRIGGLIKRKGEKGEKICAN